MSLHDFQRALVEALRGRTGLEAVSGLPPGERASAATLIASAGFRFTAAIQRSWCIGRASKAARLTLSVLPPAQARRLLEKWASVGGGTSSFFAAEADAFLEFIASNLPEPSHPLTICRVEQATLRASNGLVELVRPESSRLTEHGCWLRRGRYSTLVPFYAEPYRLFAALDGAPLPPLSSELLWVLFAPGMTGLFRQISANESVLLQRLACPTSVTKLIDEGHTREQIEAFLNCGALEFAPPHDQTRSEVTGASSERGRSLACR